MILTFGLMIGDLYRIRILGLYFVEIWKALGMKMSNIKFLWASDEINKRPNDYWLTVMDIATKFIFLFIFK
jgi:tyrosyl-tRNA synthetase